MDHRHRFDRLESIYGATYAPYSAARAETAQPNAGRNARAFLGQVQVGIAQIVGTRRKKTHRGFNESLRFLANRGDRI